MVLVHHRLIDGFWLDGDLGKKLVGNWRLGGCRGHLLSQQGNVLDVLQLCGVAQESAKSTFIFNVYSRAYQCLLVTVSLSLDFPQDVHSVVVPQSSGHLVVVHREVVLLDSPQFGQSWGINDLENASISVLPRNISGVSLSGVIQQLLQKVPKKASI